MTQASENDKYKISPRNSTLRGGRACQPMTDTAPRLLLAKRAARVWTDGDECAGAQCLAHLYQSTLQNAPLN